MKNNILKIVALLTVISSSLINFGCSNSSGQENVVRIGMTAPLTGATAESGIALKQGAELAVEEINNSGRVTIGQSQYTVRLYIEDNESKPESGVSAAERLITRDRVHYLIGDSILSSVTMAIMELAPKYQIPIVSAESVSDAIADKVQSDPQRYAYFWKMNFGSTAYADAVFNATRWLLDTGQFQPSGHKVFFMVEDTDYGRSNAQAAASLFENSGWTVVSIETVPMGYTDFYPLLGKLRGSNSDLLISIFTPLSSGVALVKQFNELGITLMHIAIYYPSRPEFLQQVGSAADGLLWTPLLFDPQNIESQRTFSETIRTKFNVQATIDHAYGYDAIYNAIDSIKRSGSLNPESIIQAVVSLDRIGVIGHYVFDPNNHQAKAGLDYIPIPVAQIQSGQNLIIWPESLASVKYIKQPWMK